MATPSIVVGTDGSATAEKAVSQAAGLAVAGGQRLVIVTAFQPELGGRDDVTTHGSTAPAELEWQLTDRNVADQRARRGRELAHETGLSDIVVQAVEGAPAEMLLEAAETFDASMIVVGSVGLASPARFVLGSVAGSVAHHAPCDVLVVHTD